MGCSALTSTDVSNRRVSRTERHPSVPSQPNLYTGFAPADLLESHVRRDGSHEGLGLLAPHGDPLADRALELGDAAEGCSPDHPHYIHRGAADSLNAQGVYESLEKQLHLPAGLAELRNGGADKLKSFVRNPSRLPVSGSV